jgi:hypothetical protein
MRLALPLLLTACAHTPPLSPDAEATLLALASFGLHAAADVIEVEAPNIDNTVACVLVSTQVPALRTAAEALTGTVALSGFSFDPSVCGPVPASVDVPDWIGPLVARSARMVPKDAPCVARATVRYVEGAYKAFEAWAEDTSQHIETPAGEVCGG